MTNPAMYVEEGTLHFNGRAIDPAHYDPNNFTLSAYQAQLTALCRAGYHAVQYDEEHDKDKTFILRHDVFFSPSHALKIAEIEKELGLKSTFFFDYKNDFYTLEDEEVSRAIAKIKEMGHNIGLHITPKNEAGELLVDGALIEHTQNCKNLFEASVGHEVSCVSFDVIELSKIGKVPAEKRVAVMVNVYGHLFADGISRSKGQAGNSNGLHLYGQSIEDHIGAGTEHLHLAVIPEWLSEVPMLPYNRLKTLPEVQKKTEALDALLDTVQKGGRCYAGDGHFPDVDQKFDDVMRKNPAYALNEVPHHPCGVVFAPNIA